MRRSRPARRARRVDRSERARASDRGEARASFDSRFVVWGQGRRGVPADGASRAVEGAVDAGRPRLALARQSPGSFEAWDRITPEAVRVRKIQHRDVAQPGSAPDWGSGGRWFESSHPDHFLTFHGVLGNIWVTTQKLMGGGRASTQSHRTNHQRVESAGVGPRRILRCGHAWPLPSHFGRRCSGVDAVLSCERLSEAAHTRQVSGCLSRGCTGARARGAACGRKGRRSRSGEESGTRSGDPRRSRGALP